MKSWNPTIYNINRLVHWDKWLVDQASDVPSIFFHDFLQNSLQKWFQCIFFQFFYEFAKIKTKSFECPRLGLGLQEIMKKIMLGTSDDWSTSHLSQQTSEPAYYIVDCRISSQRNSSLLGKKKYSFGEIQFLGWQAFRAEKYFTSKLRP